MIAEREKMKHLCNINEDENLYINEKNQFIITTLDINAPEEQFEVVIVRKSAYEKLQGRLADSRNQVSHRNMQIKELKKRIEQLEINTIYKGQL